MRFIMLNCPLFLWSIHHPNLTQGQKNISNNLHHLKKMYVDRSNFRWESAAVQIIYPFLRGILMSYSYNIISILAK